LLSSAFQLLSISSLIACASKNFPFDDLEYQPDMILDLFEIVDF